MGRARGESQPRAHRGTRRAKWCCSATARDTFVADGEVNGRRVTFLLDTGATYIALPAQLARELKLKLGPPITLQTAAGPATGYPTRLDSVRLAGIEMRDMAAVVSEGLEPGQVLLGMNFLKRLEMTQRGEQLVLKPPGAARSALAPKDGA